MNPDLQVLSDITAALADNEMPVDCCDPRALAAAAVNLTEVLAVVLASMAHNFGGSGLERSFEIADERLRVRTAAVLDALNDLGPRAHQ